MEKETPYKRSELLEWSVAEFKHNLRYIAWRAHTDKKLAEIMDKKRKK